MTLEGERVPAPGACRNCGEPLAGQYCTVCGQHRRELDRPLLDLLREWLSGVAAFDERLWRTLVQLVRRPGLLTLEFLDGRRARYVHPLKLYIAISLAFFVALSWSGYSVVRLGSPGDELVAPVRVTMSEQGSEPTEPGSLGRLGLRIVELYTQDPGRLDQLFADWLAQLMILLVPVFAALLRLLYRRRRYVAHLLFSVHLHCFGFLAILAGLLTDLLLRRAAGGPGSDLATAGILVYLFLGLRRLHGEGRWKTLAKLLTLCLAYAMALITVLLATLLMTAIAA